MAKAEVSKRELSEVHRLSRMGQAFAAIASGRRRRDSAGTAGRAAKNLSKREQAANDELHRRNMAHARAFSALG